MKIRGAAVTLNASGNESCNSQHFFGEVTSMTAGQRLASLCYCFDPANPKQILILFAFSESKTDSDSEQNPE